jgi:hypothetical protein
MNWRRVIRLIALVQRKTTLVDRKDDRTDLIDAKKRAVVLDPD